jgi:arabinogalactan oligomer/maltooligosaccharide transport system substrate-binding protein
MAIKKLLMIFTTVMLVMSLMVGCAAPEQKGSEEPATEGADSTETEETTEADTELVPEEGAELILWDNGDAEGEWANYIADKFTEKYGIPVTVEEVGHIDAPGKLQTDGPAGLGADVFAAAHDHVGNMNAAGLIIENVFADEYKERFMDATVIGTSSEDVFYGYPTSIETYALFYNIDILAEMGFEPAKTMQEVIEQSKAYQEGSAKNERFGFMMEPGNFYFSYAFLGGFGGYVFGNNGTDASDLGLNNEGAVKAGELLHQIRTEILPLKNEDITGDVISSYFNDNKLMYRISGPWDVKNHKDAGINFGIAPLPLLANGENPTSFSGIKAYYVNAYTEFPQAASLLAQFATSDEMLEKRFEMTGQLPPSLALLDSDVIKSDEISQGFLTQALYAEPMPNIPEMQSVWGPMGNALTALWNGDVAPKEALDQAVQQVEDAIKSQTK